MQNDEQESRLSVDGIQNDTNQMYQVLRNLLADKSLSAHELGLKIRELCGQTEQTTGDSNVVEQHDNHTSEHTNEHRQKEISCEISNTSSALKTLESLDTFFSPFLQAYPCTFSTYFQNQKNRLVNNFQRALENFDDRVVFMNNGFDNFWNECNELDNNFNTVNISKNMQNEQNVKCFKRSKHFSSSSVFQNGKTKTKTVSRIEEHKDGKTSVYKKITTGDENTTTVEEFLPNGKKRVTTKQQIC